VPAVGGQDVRGLIAQLADLRLGLEQDPRLGVAALRVRRVELGGDRLGPRRVLGEDELQPASARYSRPAALIRGARRKPIARASIAPGPPGRRA
jgi:hypothetical protein